MLQEENDIILDKVSWFTFLNEKDKWKKKKKFCDFVTLWITIADVIYSYVVQKNNVKNLKLGFVCWRNR